MSDQPPQKEPILSNPQILVAIVGAATTVLVALIGVLPNMIEASRPPTATPTAIVVTATSVAQVATATLDIVFVTEAILPTATQVFILTVTEAVIPTVTQAIISTATEPIIPTATEVIVPTATETIIPTATEIIVPTATQIANITLLWDNDSFTVLNAAGQKMSLEGVVFQSSSGSWLASQWGNTIYNALPTAKCVRLRDASVGNRQPPAPCANNIWGLMQVGRTAFFWKDVSSFDVMLNGTLLTTCEVAAGTCGIYIAP